MNKDVILNVQALKFALLNTYICINNNSALNINFFLNGVKVAFTLDL